jgi:hypothetical protein
VYTLCRVVRSIAIAASSVMDEPGGLLVLMFWDFYLPPIDELMVSHGCSRGEESGSLYLTDPIAIIEVRGGEVLASTLDGSRLWRRALGDQVVPRCVGSLGWEFDGNILLYFAAAA